ncbi:GH12 family glycosyl hydrolase domain-containing protein [Actinomadura miaoliensis]|uniref:Glycoside hydrolase n=1 Tax=Actinomadura miaoliensis TaxID=430685 RepID=A0ABP7WVY8_9ACTN
MRIRSALTSVVLTATLGLVAAPAAHPATGPVGAAATTCDSGGSITMGKYWLNNNLWGAGTGSGTQCVSDSYQSGNTIGWSTNWNWTGQQNSVKSYVSSVLGWHWGWKTSGTGLPVQLSANRNVNTGWTFQPNASGTYNVAYDLWLHTIPNPDWSNNPTDEVMIWLYRAGGAGPLGNKVATVSLAGATWDLYQGNIGWEVYSFVRTSNTTSANFNIRDFLNHLRSNRGLSSSKYLTSVQAGTEVFTGGGRLATASYYTNVG